MRCIIQRPDFFISRYNTVMRKFIIAVLLLLGVVLIFAQLAEIEAILSVLRGSDLRFFLLAAFIQILWVFNMALVYQRIYRELGMIEQPIRLALLVLGAFFVNIVAPTAGLGGLAVFVSDARKRGLSTARVTLAGVLFVLFDYASFLCVLALGLIVLVRRNNLDVAEIIASLILFSLAAFLAVLIYLGMSSGDALERFLLFGARSVNRIAQPVMRLVRRPSQTMAYLSEDRARFFAREAHEGLSELRGRLDNLLVPLALALCAKALLIFILSLIFLSFKVPFSLGTLVAGFSIGNLFVIVSPTPAGIGMVEGAMVLGLRSLNVPLSGAAVITLAYRALTFWLLLLGGMFSMRHLARSGESS